MTTRLCDVAQRPLHLEKFPYIRKHPFISKHPVIYDIIRCPVSKEDIAMHIGQGLPCVTLAQQHFLPALHESVEKLVLKLAIKYSESCKTSEGKDLVNDCWYRIMLKLHLYKSHKSKFTTWCWRVCLSVLNRKYRRNIRYRDHIVEMPDGIDDNRVGKEDSRMRAVCDDILSSIDDLLEENQKYKHIIEAILKDDDGYFNSKIVYSTVAKRTGVKSAKVARIHKTIVKPFFIKRFKEGKEDE